MSDAQILELAREHKALLLTEDADFGEWIFSHKAKSVGIIFLRYKSDEFENLKNSLLTLLKQYGDSLYNKFIVISANKIRIRELP